MSTTSAGDVTPTSKRRARRAAAGMLAAAAVGASLVLSAAPASAHYDHSAAYTSGTHDDCLGAASVSTGQYDDFWWGHLASTAVHVVKGSSCLRTSTSTWSDNYWTGFTNNVYIELYDRYGQRRWASSATPLKFSVSGTNATTHARRDLSTFALPYSVASSVTRIKITQLEGCCL